MSAFVKYTRWRPVESNSSLHGLGDTVVQIDTAHFVWTLDSSSKDAAVYYYDYLNAEREEGQDFLEGRDVHEIYAVVAINRENILFPKIRVDMYNLAPSSDLKRPNRWGARTDAYDDLWYNYDPFLTASWDGLSYDHVEEAGFKFDWDKGLKGSDKSVAVKAIDLALGLQD